MFKKLSFVAALALAVAPVCADTTFLHHFDGAVGGGGGDADYGVGSVVQQTPPPIGNGGQIVSSPAKFGNSLLRSNGADVGGRLTYQTAGNYNVNKGTIEMWINSSDMAENGGFLGLWGSDTSSGSGDVRMYIYNTGAGRTLGAYQAGAGGSFWEIEQVIPVAQLTDNAWHHVAWAFDCNAGVTATWWDGTLLRNTPDSGVVNPRNSFNNTRFHIGENQGGSGTWNGYMDEFRISDSIVYPTTGDFTPPTAPFSVPEPSSLGLLAVTGLVARRRRA